jgi:hypothetical protein
MICFRCWTGTLNSANLPLRLVASTVTSFLILALLLFMIHRLRQRRTLIMLRRMYHWIHSCLSDNVFYCNNKTIGEHINFICYPMNEKPLTFCNIFLLNNPANIFMSHMVDDQRTLCFWTVCPGVMPCILETTWYIFLYFWRKVLWVNTCRCIFRFLIQWFLDFWLFCKEMDFIESI